MHVRLPPLSSSAHAGRVALREYLCEHGRTDLTDDRHEAQTTLHLRLQRADRVRARDWLDALDTADRLTAAGTLLLPPFPAEMTVFRRRYIGDIVDRLGDIA